MSSDKVWTVLFFNKDMSHRTNMCSLTQELLEMQTFRKSVYVGYSAGVTSDVSDE